jgi:hypothetical protein
MVVGILLETFEHFNISTFQTLFFLHLEHLCIVRAHFPAWFLSGPAAAVHRLEDSLLAMLS